MNRKMLPVIMMLVAGAIACIATYIRDYTILEKLVTLLVALLVFYGLGCLIQGILNYFDKQNEQKRLEEEAAAKEQEEAARAEASQEQA